MMTEEIATLPHTLTLMVPCLWLVVAGNKRRDAPGLACRTFTKL